jgi:TP901 family phage tail tape measure protein
MAKAIPVPVVQTGFSQSIQAGAKAAGQINIPVNATFNAGSFNNLAQPLGKVTGLATEFEKSIAASNARVIAFGASVGIINGIQNAFKDLVTTTIEVQKSLTTIATVSNQSGKELEKFGDNLFEIAKNTGQSFKIAAEAATEFARQGLSVEQTLKRTSDALTLTRFTSLSAADSVEVLTAAVNSFANAGVTTTDILNKLVAVDSKFAVSSADLANGLSRAGSIAQEVGISLDELNGIITSVQEKTARGGAVIGNAFKTIFTNIRSEGAIKALENIGVYSKDAEGNLKPVIPILQELSSKLNDLSGVKKIQVLESIGSKYNINILSALLKDINDAQGTFQQSKAVSAGATIEAYQRQLELNKALSVALNNVYVSSEKLANSIGRIGVTDNLKGLLDFFGNLIDSVNDVIDSEGIGGNIAKGLISGLGGILFKVGIPLLTGLFVVLTKNIVQFGAESLKTILGLNSKVKEREALEQAVFNTLVKNRDIMDNMQALSGNRAKQEKYLLDIYNQQLAALEDVKKTAVSIAPGLQAAGFSATSGQLTKPTKKAAGGYLPAQEAADVSRGVGGASPSSQVVSIPNFAFGGGKTGTMIANTSEYIVPNFANGGSAIFNQDMISSFGLPAGARKLSAAGGYIPNFAKYIYDSDRIPADKNATLKAILASPAKKNLIIGPAGSGKSTMAAGMGTFLTGPADVANATEIDILSAAGRTKDGGLSKNLESIMAAVNGTGGKVSYLYTKNLDILSRRAGRTEPSEGDLRSKKQIAGSTYAPLNQFDFMGMVKSKSNSFGMVRGAGGFVPNFAQAKKGYIYTGVGVPPEGRAQIITSLGAGFRGVNSEEKLIKANYRLMDDTELSKYSSSKSQRKTASSNNIAAMLVPNTSLQYSSAEPKDPENQTYASVEFPIYKLSEQGLKNQTSNLGKKPEFFEILREQVDGLGIQLSSQLTGQPVSKDVYDRAFAKSLGAKAALDGLAGGLFETSVRALTFPESIREKGDSTLDFPDLGSKAGQILKSVFNIRGERAADLKGSDSGSIQRKFASQVLKNGLTRDTELPKFKASGGYIPNFADPLKDAVQREMDAGLDPAQIRITKDLRLKNAQNPNGFAVINTRDEPDGKVPNFVRIGAAKAGYESSDPSLIASGSPVLPKDIQSNLIKAINAQIKAFETGAIDQNQLNAEVKALTDKVQLNKKSQEKIQSQVDSAVKRSQPAAPSNKQEKKEFDFGKFLILQGAVAGATAAIQSYTEENTKASAAIETASAAGSLAITAFTLPFKANPIIATLTLLATGISTLIPAVSKWQEALKTDADRATEALFKLATQARKTGENLTPDTILNALKVQKAQEKDKKELDTYAKDVQTAFDQKNITGISEDQIKDIAKTMKDLGIAQGSKEFTDFTANIGYQEDSILGQFKSALKNIAVLPAAKGFNILTGIDVGRAGKFDNALVAKKEDVINQTETAAKKRQEDLKAGKILQPLSNVEQETATREYETLKANDALTRSITDNAINSQAAYAVVNTLLKKQGQELENNKNLTTESLYLEEKKNIAIRQAANELAKANAESEASFKDALDFGKDQGKTGLSNASLSGLDLNKLVESYTKDGLEGLNRTFIEESKRLNKQGVKTQENINVLASPKAFIDAIRKKSEQNRIAELQYNTTVQEAGIKPQTEVQKLKKEEESLSLALQKQGQYTDLLTSEQQKLINSVLDSKLKNLLLVETSKERAQSELDIALENERIKKEIFKRVKVETDAATDASKLRQSTEEKVRQFQKDGINAKEKFALDLQLLYAENDYLETLYKNVNVDTETVAEKVKILTQAKKNRRQEETTARNQAEIFKEDVNQLRGKIKVKESFNKLIEQEDLNKKAFLELESSSYDLAETQRSLIARLDPKNFEYETSQNKIKTLIDSRKTVADLLSSGDYGRSGFERESAKIDILRKRSAEFGGVDKMSQDQIDKIQQGKYSIKDNLYEEGKGLIGEAKTFQQILGQDTPKALADGLTEAMKVGLSGADNIGEALQNVAKSFLQTIQSAMLESASKNIVGSFTSAIGGSEGGYVKKFATGGMVTGGSGIRDDVPAMLNAGEYVMRKSAVQKYGAENIAKMNDGGIFLPGVRGGSAISGYDQLSKFANQTTTSGATDILKGSGSTAYANLEDQSARLSRFGLMNEDTIKGEITSAQQQGLDIIAKREAYRTQQRKAMQQQIISTAASIAIAYGAGKLGSAMKTKPTTKLEYGQNNLFGGVERLNDTVSNNLGAATSKPIMMNPFYVKGAYGGMIAGFNNGGGPTDDIPALLMGGEYVMNRASTRKYGKQYLDSMNTGRARFADGGEVGADATVESSDSKAKVDSKTGTAVNISINVSGNGSSTESQGQTSQGGVDYKKMSERIKAVVLETLNEEKRLGGSLRTR